MHSDATWRLSPWWTCPSGFKIHDGVITLFLLWNAIPWEIISTSFFLLQDYRWWCHHRRLDFNRGEARRVSKSKTVKRIFWTFSRHFLGERLSRGDYVDQKPHPIFLPSAIHIDANFLGGEVGQNGRLIKIAQILGQIIWLLGTKNSTRSDLFTRKKSEKNPVRFRLKTPLTAWRVGENSQKSRRVIWSENWSKSPILLISGQKSVKWVKIADFHQFSTFLRLLF